MTLPSIDQPGLFVSKGNEDMESKQKKPFSPLCLFYVHVLNTQIKEIPDDEVKKIVLGRHAILSVQPHGVFSFGGACAAVQWGRNWWHPTLVPTAVASSVSPLLLDFSLYFQNIGREALFRFEQ
jgi:hypothetical protein